MDLKAYYRKLREAEAGISEEHAVVASHATGDGGREGVLTEVPRAVAARLIVQGSAELASPEQAAAFRERMFERHRNEEARRTAARIQVSVISEAEARALGGHAGAARPPLAGTEAKAARPPLAGTEAKAAGPPLAGTEAKAARPPLAGTERASERRRKPA